MRPPQKLTAVLIICVLTVGVTLISAGQSIDFSQALQAMQTISGKEAHDHALFLASREMRGRDAASPEQGIAARYLANEFRKYGLKAVGDDNSYFQYFQLQEVTLGENNKLEVITNKSGAETRITKPFQLGYDFLPTRNSQSYRIENAEAVFVGYGITAPEYKYDDYAGIDVTGKVVLALTHEPQEKDTTSIFARERDTRYFNNELKAATAYHHGAIGLLLVADPLNHPKRELNKNVWKKLADPVQLADRRTTPQLRLPDDRVTIPVFNISDQVVAELFKGTTTDLLELQRKIDSDLKPRSMILKGKRINLESEVLLVKNHTGINVMGYLEGSDSLYKDEVVIIGGHYDALGVNSKGEVLAGANDNAGAVATILEIAQAFATSPVQPKRSLLFMGFGGEELGLLGSRYYMDHPVFPVQKTIAMLNLDVMSRDDSYTEPGDTLHSTIFYANVCPQLQQLNEQAVKHVGYNLEIKFSDWLLPRSDHAPFFWKGIPSIFYAGGPSSGGHSPKDLPEKLVPDEMEAIGRLAFLTAWGITFDLVTPTIEFKIGK